MSNLDESTKKLFGAIDAENLEDFKQALAEGADVNAFDVECMTPLMSIANAYIASNNQPTLERMAKLLIQNSNIDINAQSKQPVYEERQKKDQRGRLIYLLCGREVVEAQLGWYRYCDNDQLVNNVDDQGEHRYLSSHYEGVKEQVITSLTQKNTALHIACQVAAKDMVKILLTHPDVETDVKNCNRKSPEDCISRGFEDTIKLEFKKAQKGKQLLNSLSSKNIYPAKVLLNEELNPNCWERNKNGEIETPLSLIIKSCLQIVTRDKEEVLTKLLKHKELDFSQMKPIQAIEQNPRLKQIIKQAMTEKLTDAINSKDLDDVKKLVEDNRFMNYAIVVAALRDVGDPIESIKNYLNEKFPASVEQPLADMNDTPVGFEEFVQELVDELEKAKAQLAEKERELNSIKRAKLNQQTRMSVLTDQVIQLTREKSQLENLRDELERTKAQLAKKEQELDRIIHKEANSARDLNQEKQEKRIRTLTNQVNQLTKENAQLRAQNQNFKNKKSSEASAPGKKQSNHASVFFILSGAFTVGACLTIPDLEICIPLAVVALGLFLIGCYLLCKKNEQDIGPSGITDNPRIKMVLASSPSSSENFYTC